MSWSVIIYTAMLLTDLLSIKEFSKPFTDSLLIDLAIVVLLGILFIFLELSILNFIHKSQV